MHGMHGILQVTSPQARGYYVRTAMTQNASTRTYTHFFNDESNVRVYSVHTSKNYNEYGTPFTKN